MAQSVKCLPYKHEEKSVSHITHLCLQLSYWGGRDVHILQSLESQAVLTWETLPVEHPVSLSKVWMYMEGVPNKIGMERDLSR